MPLGCGVTAGLVRIPVTCIVKTAIRQQASWLAIKASVDVNRRWLFAGAVPLHPGLHTIDMRLDRAFTPIRFASSHKVFSVNISILFYFLGHKPKGGLLLAELPWKDGKCRCSWANPQNELYVRYHDEEWGVPVHDDGRLFEMLILENFQAGLTWECVLNKREAFRRAFDGFDLRKVASYSEEKLTALQADSGIIRNRLKIRAAVVNAQVFQKIQQEWGSFDRYLWHWTEKKIIQEVDKVSSPLSDAVSKDLKKRGMKFVGTIIIYAYLQAVGVINSHESGCFLNPLQQ